MIKIGDSVVCIDASHNYKVLKAGKIYTVSSIVTCPICKGTNYELAEIVDVPGFTGSRCSCGNPNLSRNFYVFKAQRFKPVAYPKLSYSDIAKQNVEERLDVPVKHSVPAKQY